MDLPPLIPMHPPKLCTAPMHQTNRIQNVRGAVAFVPNLEISIPWKRILLREEYLFLQHHLCSGIELDTVSFRRNHINGQEHWTTHCHCGDPTSLQCLAASRMIKSLVEEFLSGANFNVEHMFYRSYVNADASDQLLYQGSFTFRDLHLIYVKCMRDTDSIKLRHLQVPGMEAIYCNGDYSNYYVLICKSCKNQTQEQAYSCAYHTRKWMERGLKRCMKPRRKSLLEFSRNKQLINFYKFGTVVTHFNGFF